MPQPQFDASRPDDFLSPQDESRAFGRLRFRILASLLRQTFVQARFRVSLVVVLTSLLWGGMFWIFLDGFRIPAIDDHAPRTHAQTVAAVFGHFFFWLMLMLVFSSGIILYGSLFRSREIAFLLTFPANGAGISPQIPGSHRLEQLGICAPGKSHASGLRDRGPRPGTIMRALAVLVAFLYIPVAIGAILCLWVVRRIPKPSGRAGVGAACCCGGIAGSRGAAGRSAEQPAHVRLVSGDLRPAANLRPAAAAQLVAELRLAGNAAAGDWYQSVLFLALLISNALFSASWPCGRRAGSIATAYSGLSA